MEETDHVGRRVVSEMHLADRQAEQLLAAAYRVLGTSRCSKLGSADSVQIGWDRSMSMILQEANS